MFKIIILYPVNILKDLKG